ncbi:MAG: hypothetical protein K2Q22_06120 [Cytophagales bacterium]|nr:hypothetical protein [Cytophagales bacterium]
MPWALLNCRSFVFVETSVETLISPVVIMVRDCVPSVSVMLLEHDASANTTANPKGTTAFFMVIII